jgi:hypothetical protein
MGRLKITHKYCGGTAMKAATIAYMSEKTLQSATRKADDEDDRRNQY